MLQLFWILEHSKNFLRQLLGKQKLEIADMPDHMIQFYDGDEFLGPRKD